MTADRQALECHLCTPNSYFRTNSLGFVAILTISLVRYNKKLDFVRRSLRIVFSINTSRTKPKHQMIPKMQPSRLIDSTHHAYTHLIDSTHHAYMDTLIAVLLWQWMSSHPTRLDEPSIASPSVIRFHSRGQRKREHAIS